MKRNHIKRKFFATKDKSEKKKEQIEDGSYW